MSDDEKEIYKGTLLEGYDTDLVLAVRRDFVKTFWVPLVLFSLVPWAVVVGVLLFFH